MFVTINRSLYSFVVCGQLLSDSKNCNI